MKKETKRGIYIVSVIIIGLIAIALIFVLQQRGVFYSPGKELIKLSSCGNLNKPGAVYILTGNLTGIKGGCFYIGADGITLYGGGNIISGTGKGNGVLAQNRKNVAVRNLVVNNFENGIVFQSGKGNDISGNTITLNTNQGIFVQGGSGIQIKGNVISSNKRYGTFIQGSSSNILLENNLYSNGYGIFIQGGSNNKVYDNNFISNRIHALVQGGKSNLFNNENGGNYWGRCIDLNKDNFCDKSYAFSGGVDNRPISQEILLNLDNKDSKLIWPIGCSKGTKEECSPSGRGYPDIDGNGVAFDCEPPGITGHAGTDIGISWEQMDKGIPVFAAEDGEVLWVFDGKYDRCPNDKEPDCQEPAKNLGPGESSGISSCTSIGPYCGLGTYGCYLCNRGGNEVWIRHNKNANIYMTKYAHLKKNSITVKTGNYVVKGQKIGEVGSSGASSGPHLHFEVVGAKGFGNPVDPWAGPCGTNFGKSLWEDQNKIGL